MTRTGSAHSHIRGRFDPAAVAAAIAGSGLLRDYVVYERAGRWLIGGNPVGAVTVGPGWLYSTVGGEFTESWTGSPWPRVHTALRRCPHPRWRALGWASFELAHPTTADTAEVLAHVMVPGIEIEVTADAVRVHTHDGSPEPMLADLVAGLPDAATTPIAVDALDPDYLHRVERAVARIRGGELEKVILSRTVEVPFPVDMPATYVAGRRANTPARSFLLDLGGWQAAGFSPETVLEADASGRAATQPLAGTRARTGAHRSDELLRTELLGDPKEVFEHAISVKLAFEEMAGVGRPGATRVSEFLTVKDRGSVQHLGSRVETSLAHSRTAWDALTTVFPAITASGIPKAAACAVIDALEPEPRGLYSGAVLLADSTGALDAALVLRAVYQRAGRAWLRAGAGIVAASTPEREHEETREKLASVAPYVVPAHSAPRSPEEGGGRPAVAAPTVR
ncbi:MULTISPECIES: salicylate synthase [unclassified Nocardia]|uniref:salicylate synthase n=1 Tax=unclassified Nocardia TaxID=2637762 RepID=UPI0024AA0229|nr:MULTISPECIES: salicylate synthase [unclassified Nocardia]